MAVLAPADLVKAMYQNNPNWPQHLIDTITAGVAGAAAFSSPTGAKLILGTGVPAVAAPVGSVFIRTDGGTSTTFYVKETGAGTTGWVAK